MRHIPRRWTSTEVSSSSGKIPQKEEVERLRPQEPSIRITLWRDIMDDLRKAEYKYLVTRGVAVTKDGEKAPEMKMGQSQKDRRERGREKRIWVEQPMGM